MRCVRSPLRIPLLVALLALAVSGALAQELAPECEYAPDGPAQPSVGVVDCLRFDSAMMGGIEPFTARSSPTSRCGAGGSRWTARSTSS